MDTSRFINVIESMGYEAQPYSGRFMYGKECVGFVTELEATRAIVDIALGCDEDERTDLLQILRGARTDNMGRSSIIVYFPSIVWPESASESESESA